MHLGFDEVTDGSPEKDNGLCGTVLLGNGQRHRQINRNWCLSFRGLHPVMFPFDGNVVRLFDIRDAVDVWSPRHNLVVCGLVKSQSG